MPVKAPPAAPPMPHPAPANPTPSAPAAPALNSPAKSEKIVHVRGLKKPRSRQPILKAVVVASVIGLFVGAVFFLIYTLGPSLRPIPGPGGGHNPGLAFYVRNHRGQDEKAFTLTLDKGTWAVDKEMKNRLKALAAFKRADPSADAWVAVAVQDFGFRKPREGELLNGAIERLRVQFGDSLMINTKPEPAKVGGVEASRCAFVGRTNIVWNGECYLVPHHGFAYWIFVASPTLEAAQQQFAELDEQKAFAFTTERRGWTEQPPDMESFAALGNAFFVQAPRLVWRKNDPKTEDENGVIFLSGLFQSLSTHGPDFATAKNATFVGVALDRKADLREAYKSAVAYFEKRKLEESKDYRFEPIEATAHLKGELAEVGDQPGSIGEAKLMRGAEKMRFIVFAAFNDAAKTYGLRFECAWENQMIWRKEFQELIKTVRLGSK
jgi:hypothetical protein